jgi:hypothetical protein
MTDIAEHLPRYERKPRTDIASVNEAAAHRLWPFCRSGSGGFRSARPILRRQWLG